MIVDNFLLIFSGVLCDINGLSSYLSITNILLLFKSPFLSMVLLLLSSFKFSFISNLDFFALNPYDEKSIPGLLVYL